MVFGLTSALMLFCTLWMLASDHNREWKQYQRQFQNLEAYTAQSRISAQESADYYAKDAQLEAALNTVKSEAPDESLVAEFVDVAKPREKANGYNLAAIEKAQSALDGAKSADEDQRIELRKDLVAAMQNVLDKAKLDEDNRQRALKFKRADLDVVRSEYNIAVGEGKPEEELHKLEDKVKAVEAQVADLTKGTGPKAYAYQQANEHRLKLQKILERINAGEAAAQKTLADHRTDLKRLETTLAERQSNFGKSLLEMPIIDAFGRPLKIDNIWLPQLTWNNNFRDVARYDRCTTCHQGIDKTGPGSAVNPGYPETVRETLTIATPAEPVDLTAEQTEHLDQIKAEQGKAAAKKEEEQYKLVQLYGFQLAPHGLFDANEVTVSVVRPETAAANARLEPGDVIEQINDVKLLNREEAIPMLLEFADFGKPMQLHVRRGIPHPFSSHPRLDLFVGSLSPHKLGDVGCTICHEGQGSATAFKWASHTPNSPAQSEEWTKKYGWFNNHHWIFPMPSKRFAESTCLKCHHEVVELEPSEKFPDPPAPKLMAGYDTIEKFGCFGCHEINGFDGPNKRRGPDLRAEPNYFAAAQQLLADPNLTDREKELAHEVAAHPERTATRKLLAELIAQSAKQGDESEDEASEESPPRLSAASLELGKMLGADDETPGKYRKVGPSLRHVGKKVDLAFLYSWINNPTNFRPSTKMPRFFGLWDHLKTDEAHDVDAPPKPGDHSGLADSKRFEPIEVRAVAEYLLEYSQPFDYAEPPQGITEEASAERGKHLFQVRGCLACHQHKEFPEAKQTQGPDLSRIGAKLDTDNGKQWLYSWVLEPNRYHARTVMPNLFLNPITDEKDPKKVSDPAADITAYLLTSQEDWKPEALPKLDPKDLNALTKIHLLGSFSNAKADLYVDEGIPQEAAGELKVDEKLLLQGEDNSPEALERKKLLYVGRRTIGRFGCSGCHDIPGFEDAKPIGTGLADWGRKDTSKLAFEQIVEYLRDNPPGVHGHDAHGEHGEGGHGEHHSLNPDEMDKDTGFFVEALLNHEREGFIWQKLREPRSYDFKMTENKAYTDRLRMPKFNFSQEDIENVMTFVLGLVSEPPAAKYVYQPNPRRKAIIEGERLLAKYNCVGCHTVKMEEWEFEYKPDEFEAPPALPDYAFLKPHFTPEQLAASKKVDARGMGRAVISGMPNPDVQEDDDGKPLYLFSLWEPAAINGETWTVGGVEVPVPEARRLKTRPFHGGDFSRYLHPVAVEMGKKNNPNVKPTDVWGWVPPPLIREGEKVQTGWLHDFLLDPFMLRPAVVLRMPKFNMSSEEADKFVHYFAAVDNVDYPYEYNLPGGGDSLSSGQSKELGSALELVTDGKNYCVKCHMLGDYKPKGLAADMAPNLDRIYQRLRPGYLKEWLAHPQVKLPYTGMPVNFPPQNDPNEAIRTKYFPGTSEEALSGVVDLLLNFDSYMKRRTSIKSMVKEPPPAAGEKAALDETAKPAKASGGR